MNAMTLIEKAFILKKTPMFSSLELDLLLPIADKVHINKVDAKEVVFDVKEQAYSLYIIAEGSVEILDADKNLIRLLNEGDVFGDESIFSGQPRGYRAFSKTPSTFLTLSKADLLAIIYEYPRVATGFLEVYAHFTPFRPR